MRIDAVMQQDEGETDLVHIDQAAEIFGMLSDPTRIRLIVAMDDHGELSVNHLADIVDKSPAAVSQHLAKLRSARMVTNRRQGTTIFYALVDEHAIDLVRNSILQAEHPFNSYPRHHNNESSN